MSFRARPFHLAVAVASGLVASAVGAQTPAPPSSAAAVGIDSSPAAHGRAALVGRVHAPNSEAIAEAELTVLGEGPRGQAEDGRTVRTGPGGAFRADSIVPGRYFVRVRRLGFEPLYFSATLDGGTTRRIDVEMSPLAARLAEVKVRSASGYNGFTEKRLRDFEFRRRMGFGRFYTRDDLRAYQGRLLSSALPYLTFGVRRRGLDFSPFPTSSYSGADCRGARAYNTGGYASAGYGNSRCGFMVSVNGAPPFPSDATADYPVSDIEALEVYGSVVVIWTGVETDD